MKAKVIIITVLVYLVHTTCAMAAVNSSAFRYEATVALQKDAPFTLLEIEPKVYASMSPMFVDLRVVDNKGQEVGYMVEEEDQSPLESEWQAISIINNGKLQQSNKWSFTLKDVPNSVNQYKISLSSEQYLVRVSVAGSNDNQTWQELGTRVIYRIGNNSNSFEFNDVDYQYLRFEYQQPEGQELRPEWAKARLANTATVPYHYADYQFRTEHKDKQTILNIDLGSRNFPNNAIQLSTEDSYFYRRAYLEGRNDGKDWRRITDFYLYKGVQGVPDNLGTTYADNKARFLRLVIENGNNQPLTFNKVKVAQTSIRLVLKTAACTTPLRLYWGNDSIKAPDYDVERIRNGQSEEHFPKVRLTAYHSNPAYLEPREPVSEQYPWLLPSALILALLVVGSLQYRSIKKVQDK